MGNLCGSSKTTPSAPSTIRTYDPLHYDLEVRMACGDEEGLFAMPVSQGVDYSEVERDVDLVDAWCMTHCVQPVVDHSITHEL